MDVYHIPVMLEETIKFLNVKKDCWYIDCNLGGGGHTAAILKAGGKVLGIDLDPESIREVAKNYNLHLASQALSLRAYSDNMILFQSNFSKIKEVVEELKLGPIMGILFDLGVSSHQLEKPERGFSFNTEAPLDMRMDPANMKVTAADLVNVLGEKELSELFRKYGEENFARPIAKKIVQLRRQKKIENTDELANIILSVRHRSKADRTHPATRVFQALRIAVNDELHSLQAALPQTLDILDKGGIIVVLSFHSLEDRIVKNFFKNEEKNGTVKILTQKPLLPSLEEEQSNPRSRSGKLRAAEKII